MRTFRCPQCGQKPTRLVKRRTGEFVGYHCKICGLFWRVKHKEEV